MPTLRITQSGANVEAAFEGDGLPRQTVTRPFSFGLSAQDAEDIRWYLEDYLVYPLDPAPRIAARIERRLRDVGIELFRAILEGSDVWASARHRLEETRVEVESDVQDPVVPWELLRDPAADLPLALHVPSFVRGHSKAALRPRMVESATGKIRILVAICRPGGADDVPFRSVARRLLKSAEAREQFTLEVLRPPTFEQLAKRLRSLKANGEPFHVVHFDGHGSTGAVYFENPALDRNAEEVPAAAVGKLLRECGVPVLILNACRSAHAEPPEHPEAADVHEQVRTFGSLAHAVMDYGASGVVAWRYNVFVSTAAQFMADLYAALASGLSLGEAVTLSRKQLKSATRPIEDWMVPVVFEAASVRLFPKAEAKLKIKLQEGGETAADLPAAPDIGFIGRDETILALDRMFDSQPIVLLHAYAGSGKTSTAVEFVRWYQQTGGLDGPVLFTSFEQHKALGPVLDQLGRVFEGALEKNGIHWLTLDDEQRRSVALQVLKQVPVLWIWDNVEPIAGFPAGTASAWSEAEQNELADFLRAARGTKAKFLLTSRRDERDWLHDLPGRVQVPSMPFEERVEMTAALAAKYGRRLEDVEDWRPLLQYTQGNPLTLTVLVGCAVRGRLRNKAQIEDFVRKVQEGGEVFEDEASEGRTRSLSASLAYGFENAFSHEERKQLALLHLFQGFVNVNTLVLMGYAEDDWHLDELKGLTREAGTALLNRGAEVGFLTVVGSGYYNIHPALPWFFRRAFKQYYPEAESAAKRAFVESVGYWGSYYFVEYEKGNREVIDVLGREEANLLHARSLARCHGWWRRLISAMQGLWVFYAHTGRRADWRNIVQEIVPYFVDPTNQGPLPGKEDAWELVTEYRAELALDSRLWEEAELLLALKVDWDRRRAAAALAKPAETWDSGENHHVRNLTVSLHQLAPVQRERGSLQCLDCFQEVLKLAETLRDSQKAAVCAFNLGQVFENLDPIRDLSLARQWYRRSLELFAKGDRLGRGKCLAHLGSLAYNEFLDAVDGNHSDHRCRRHLSEAAAYYYQALDTFPTSAFHDLAVTHYQLGMVCGLAGQIETALNHDREAIRYFERQGGRFEAGQTRSGAAAVLARQGGYADAREWARAALRDFQASPNADQEVVRTLKLLEEIESHLQETELPS